MRNYFWILIVFILVTLLVALCFWIYLNITAQLTTKTSDIDITLPHRLSTTMQIKKPITSQSKGQLDTNIEIDHTLYPLLQGKYPAQLRFKAVVPIRVHMKYSSYILIDDHLSIQSNTDLVYSKKYLPKLPITLNIPIKLKVPFTLDQEFELNTAIDFNDQVIFDFDELMAIPVRHHFYPRLDINDSMTLQLNSSISANLFNQQQNMSAKMKAKIDIPFRNISNKSF